MSPASARIATALLDLADEETRATGGRRVVLHAQVYARELYEQAGYRPRGHVFREAGIDHIAMEKRLQRRIGRRDSRGFADARSFDTHGCCCLLAVEGVVAAASARATRRSFVVSARQIACINCNVAPSVAARADETKGMAGVAQPLPRSTRLQSRRGKVCGVADFKSARRRLRACGATAKRCTAMVPHLEAAEENRS